MTSPTDSGNKMTDMRKCKLRKDNFLALEIEIDVNGSDDEIDEIDINGSDDNSRCRDLIRGQASGARLSGASRFEIQ